jgi:hypothetical protein
VRAIKKLEKEGVSANPEEKESFSRAFNEFRQEIYIMR